MSDWQRQPSSGPPAGLRFKSVVLMPPRQGLWQAIETRFRAMVGAGAIAEAQAVLGSGAAIDRPAFKALGFAGLINYLKNNIELDQAITEGIYDTRHYAKRQTTWFKHQILTDLLLEKTFPELKHGEIFAFIRQNLLTPLK